LDYWQQQQQQKHVVKEIDSPDPNPLSQQQRERIEEPYQLNVKHESPFGRTSKPHDVVGCFCFFRHAPMMNPRRRERSFSPLVGRFVAYFHFARRSAPLHVRVKNKRREEPKTRQRGSQ
jgi:hypothetical protein